MRAPRAGSTGLGHDIHFGGGVVWVFPLPRTGAACWVGRTRGGLVRSCLELGLHRVAWLAVRSLIFVDLWLVGPAVRSLVCSWLGSPLPPVLVGWRWFEVD